MLLLLLALQEFDGAIQPQVVATQDGAVYVAMIQGGNIVVAASADGGKTFEKPVTAIDAGGRAKGGKRRGPRIGADAKGQLVVTSPACFDEAEFKKPYPTSELWIVRSSDQGKTWTKPARVNEVPKKAAESLHWLAVDDEGTAHVAWLDARDNGVNSLWYTQVKGEKVGKNVKLTGAVCECCAPGMALDAKGNPAIAVREGQKADRGVLFLLSTNGGKSFKPAVTVNDGKSNVDS